MAGFVLTLLVPVFVCALLETGSVFVYLSGRVCCYSLSAGVCLCTLSAGVCLYNLIELIK